MNDSLKVCDADLIHRDKGFPQRNELQKGSDGMLP